MSENGTRKLVENVRRARPRLRELRRILAEVLPGVLNGHQFDMTRWVKDLTRSDGVMCVPPLECHTAACSVGWGAILSPSLQAAGLRIVRHGRWYELSDSVAPSEFFGLTSYGAAFLFFPGFGGGWPNRGKGEPARLEAIRRIDEALDECGEPRPPRPSELRRREARP